MTQDTEAETTREKKYEDDLVNEIRDCLEITIVFEDGSDFGALTEQYISLIQSGLMEAGIRDKTKILFNSARRLPVPVLLP